MFGYDTKLLPNKYLAKLETGVTSIEDAREKTGATIGQPGWGLLYYLLLSHLDRNREEIIVETGTNLGMTTIILAQALIDSGCRGKVMTFELETENLTRAVLNFKKAGVENSIEQFQGDSVATLPKALKDIDKIRFCFWMLRTCIPMLRQSSKLYFQNSPMMPWWFSTILLQLQMKVKISE